ncbi:hypothetical protein DFH08DRAFT_809760 [Mycena albidolilacea]|uniref:Uncharacterized protein n=1 Tax=Mycena albidolilacea TaxID=1033008 RepID=A0AAD7A0B9_9AGAR|nr:hypothetical protein DFH08DRAFT_809760 [Mycena albidolilacea]
MIHRNYGESLVQAVEKIANASMGPSAPQVMLGFLGPKLTPLEDQCPAVQTFYQDYQWVQIQEASNTEKHMDTTVRKVRQQIFGGVYSSAREKRKAGEMKDLHGSKEAARIHDRGAESETPVIEEVPPVTGLAQAPSAVTPEKLINTRHARFADGEDKEMPEAQSKEKAIKGSGQKGSRNSEDGPANVDKATRPLNLQPRNNHEHFLPISTTQTNLITSTQCAVM